MNAYDFFLFASQSNMAGRGISCPQFPEAAPALISGAGVEFRAISDPSALFSVCEPFGSAENTPDGIHEPGIFSDRWSGTRCFCQQRRLCDRAVAARRRLSE